MPHKTETLTMKLVQRSWACQLDWFEHIDTSIFCKFLTRWPTLQQARRARKNTLKRFINEHNMLIEQLLEKRLVTIKTAATLTLDVAVILPYRLQALALVQLPQGIKQTLNYLRFKLFCSYQ